MGVRCNPNSALQVYFAAMLPYGTPRPVCKVHVRSCTRTAALLHAGYAFYNRGILLSWCPAGLLDVLLLGSRYHNVAAMLNT